MLRAGNARERGNSFEEETDVMVGGEATAARVDLCIAAGFAEPADDVLQYALLELMKDIRDDSLVDIEEREGLPERGLYRPNIGLRASLREYSGTFFDSRERA